MPRRRELRSNPSKAGTVTTSTAGIRFSLVTALLGRVSHARPHRHSTPPLPAKVPGSDLNDHPRRGWRLILSAGAGAHRRTQPCHCHCKENSNRTPVSNNLPNFPHPMRRLILALTFARTQSPWMPSTEGKGTVLQKGSSAVAGRRGAEAASQGPCCNSACVMRAIAEPGVRLNTDVFRRLR